MRFDGAAPHEQIIGGNGEVNVGHGMACPTTDLLSEEKWCTGRRRKQNDISEWYWKGCRGGVTP
jgi:hypothetical protein